MSMNTQHLRQGVGMGLGGVEPPTSRLSGGSCENGLCSSAKRIERPTITPNAQTNKPLSPAEQGVNSGFQRGLALYPEVAGIFAGTTNMLQTVKTRSVRVGGAQ